MERRPENFGIEDAHIVGDHLQTAYSEIEFETATGLSREEVGRWQRRVERMPALFAKDMWTGLGFRLFHPDRPKPPAPRSLTLPPSTQEPEHVLEPRAAVEPQARTRQPLSRPANFEPQGKSCD